MDDEIPILDEEKYSTWRIEMRVYLKTMGATIWKATIGGSVPLRNKSKFAAQRGGNKNDALALKTILNGLSSPIKESMGQCTSAKDLWLKLEETYQKKKEDVEDHFIKIIKGKESLTLDCICDDFKGNESCDDAGKKEYIEDTSNEGKESPKTLDCIDSKCDDVEFFSSEEDNLETICVKFDDSYPMEIIEENLLELQKEIEEGLYRYRSDHFYTHYNYLSDNTKMFLRRIQRYILMLKEMIKESNKTQLEEKEEEITRLKNEK
jgi:hypothetical protein